MNHCTITLATLTLATVTLAALVSTVSMAQAQTIYVTSDRTVANGNPITNTSGAVRVGVTSTGALVSGVNADIVSPASVTLQSRSTSNVTLQGGSLNNFQIYDDSKLTISGGSTGVAGTATSTVANANDRSRITVNGGILHDGFTLSDEAVGAITGGTFNSVVRAQDNSRLVIQEGTLNGLQLSQASVTDIYGGLFRYSTVPSTQSGSPVPVSTDVQGNATMNVYGGNFVAQDIRVFGTATNLNISGGSLGRIDAFNNGAVNISGGVFNNVLLCNFNQGGTPYGVYNLYGSNFALTNARAFNFNDQYINAGAGTMYDISGTLADGNVISGRYFLQGRTVAQGPTGLSFNNPAVVPEANTAALLGLALSMIGTVAVVRRRNKK